ncbi:MAG: ArgR family transcriptional regulator [Pseudomonadota bacterium]
MPTEPRQQEARRAAIRNLLANESIRTQAALIQRLKALGHIATQSSISRDLKDLRVVKDPEGYHLAHSADDETLTLGALEFVRSTAAAGPNLLVVQTAVGAAQRVAVELDRSGWSEIVGTLSGDDTIFVATPSATANRKLQQRLASGVKGTSV